MEENKNIVTFVVYGKPVGKMRARTVRNGNYTHSYTPNAQIEYESKIKQAYVDAGGKKLDGAVSVVVSAYFEPPKSTSKKLRARMCLYKAPRTKKPDIDNILKSVLDGLNGVAYEDDSNVTNVSMSKKYGEQSKIIVTIWSK